MTGISIVFSSIRALDGISSAAVELSDGSELFVITLPLISAVAGSSTSVSALCPVVRTVSVDSPAADATGEVWVISAGGLMTCSDCNSETASAVKSMDGSVAGAAAGVAVGSTETETLSIAGTAAGFTKPELGIVGITANIISTSINFFANNRLPVALALTVFLPYITPYSLKQGHFCIYSINDIYRNTGMPELSQNGRHHLKVLNNTAGDRGDPGVNKN